MLALLTVTAASAGTVVAATRCPTGCSAQAVEAPLAAPTQGSPTPGKRPPAPTDEPVKAPAASPPRTGGRAGRLDPLLQRIDDLRMRGGCPAWTHDDALTRAAAAHARVVADAGGVSHVDGTGATAQDRARRQGYRGHVIELVAQGTIQANEFVTALIQVANQTDLLDCRYRSVGAAQAGRHLVIVLGDR